MKDRTVEQCTPRCFEGQSSLIVRPKPRKTGYMCAVDWRWHVENAASGARIYPSRTQLEASRPCVRECGIVRVKVVLDKVVHGEVWDLIRRKRKAERNARRRKPLTFK